MEARAKRVAELRVAWEAAEDAELLLPFQQTIRQQQRMIELLNLQLLHEKLAAGVREKELLKEVASAHQEVSTVSDRLAERCKELLECYREDEKAAKEGLVAQRHSVSTNDLFYTLRKRKCENSPM